MPIEHEFWFFQAKDLISILILVCTIIAIIVGPIAAVRITRAHDDRREVVRRKFDIFHALMKTRRFTLHQDHVMALNLVQVEFYGNVRIDAAYKAYMKMLYRDVPKPEDSEAKKQQFFEEQEDALYDLLHEIGSDLGLHYDKRDLKKLAYGPVGWQNDETLIRAFRHMALELLQGRRALPIVDIARWSNKFPPAPTITDGKYPPPPNNGASPNGFPE